MEILIVFICLIICIILWLIMENSFKKIKGIKILDQDEYLKSITNKLPTNIEISRDVLKKFNNEKVIVKEQEGDLKDSFYFIATNTILISNMKNSFVRVQTVIHECLHSIQNKKMLWFNFIFSNVYIIYFFIVSIMNLFNKTKFNILHIILLILAGFIYYFIRSFLELDAITKAEYESKDYMRKFLENEELELIINKYKQINKIGTKMMMFSLFSKTILKVMLFCLICLI